LPQTVSADGATAEYRNGVLRVTLPKREETKARRIQVGGEDAPTKGKTIEAKAENVTTEKSSKAASGS
jgi:HSP20 family protein